jgi:nucleotide-binding universal stress UspA family protein
MSSARTARKVVAAVDNSLAGNPVLVTARALARVLGARVEGIYVVAEGEPPPHEAAAAVGVPLRVVTGPVVERLAEAGCAEDTVAMVIGARSRPTSPHALGSTALAVLASATKPVVVVPPDGRIAPRITRVLVPLDRVSASLGPVSPFDSVEGMNLEVVGLHVGVDEVEDAKELLNRFLPSGIGAFRLESRAGKREELVPSVADELDCDLIAFAWAPEVAISREVLVRGAQGRSPLPIMLVPAQLERAEGQQAVSVH